MTATLDDYWRVLDSFVAAMSELGDDLDSLLLWGSMARGEAIPGVSDVLDVVVVVRRGLLDQREGFQRTVQRIVAACVPAAQSGLPFVHPPFLFAEEELGDLLDVERPTLVSPRSSRVLFGKDVRPEVLASPEARMVASCAYFSLQRRYVHPFTTLLQPSHLTEGERAVLWHLLTQMRNNFPTVACAALGWPTNRADALTELRQYLPDVDLSVYDEITAIRRGERALDGTEQLQDLFRRVFEAGERVGERILASGAEPWSGYLSWTAG